MQRDNTEGKRKMPSPHTRKLQIWIAHLSFWRNVSYLKHHISLTSFLIVQKLVACFWKGRSVLPRKNSYHLHYKGKLIKDAILKMTLHRIYSFISGRNPEAWFFRLFCCIFISLLRLVSLLKISFGQLQQNVTWPNRRKFEWGEVHFYINPYSISIAPFTLS